MWGFVDSGNIWVAVAFTVAAVAAWLTLPVWIDEGRPVRSEAIKTVCVALTLLALLTVNFTMSVWLARDDRQYEQVLTVAR